jgi:hypothetical protein
LDRKKTSSIGTDVTRTCRSKASALPSRGVAGPTSTSACRPIRPKQESRQHSKLADAWRTVRMCPIGGPSRRPRTTVSTSRLGRTSRTTRRTEPWRHPSSTHPRTSNIASRRPMAGLWPLPNGRPRWSAGDRNARHAWRSHHVLGRPHHLRAPFTKKPVNGSSRSMADPGRSRVCGTIGRGHRLADCAAPLIGAPPRRTPLASIGPGRPDRLPRAHWLRGLESFDSGASGAGGRRGRSPAQLGRRRLVGLAFPFGPHRGFEERSEQTRRRPHGASLRGSWRRPSPRATPLR